MIAKEAPDRERALRRKMYGLRSRSGARRVALALCMAGWVALDWWLLFGGGLEMAGPGDAIRRACLAAGFSIYFVRILFTEFVFLKPGVSWSEVATIVVWIGPIVLLLATAGGTNATGFGPTGVAGTALFAFGSWMNSYSEYVRHRWKARPENLERLYTRSLFRLARHPNYLGDLSAFAGLCRIAGAWITAIIPMLMLAGFAFVNIPVLDGHLRGRHGREFDAYAPHTRKLIPFIY